MEPEYSPAHPACPHPERWQMMDDQTAEVEVLEFLAALVRLLKPALVIETGAFAGWSARYMAEALRQNRQGRLVTCEVDSRCWLQATARLRELGQWAECRNEDSLVLVPPGRIDLLFLDSELGLRRRELEHFRPWLSPACVVAVHDTALEDGWLEREMRAERDFEWVRFDTPRGLLVGRRRDE